MNNEYPYFKWLLKSVGLTENDLSDDTGYSYLLHALFNRTFYAVLDKDENRAFDGETLRQDYADMMRMPEPELGDCRVLEMLVSIAQRIENEIMYDNSFGSRTQEWFWMMIRNLGLIRYDNRHFDAKKVDDILTDFMDRSYDFYGHGGLFPVKDRSKCDKDQREIEIWWQMQRYMLDKYWA